MITSAPWSASIWRAVGTAQHARQVDDFQAVQRSRIRLGHLRFTPRTALRAAVIDHGSRRRYRPGMIERELDIATQDGAMNTWTVRPDDGGPLPVVLMLMDAPGVREGLREICRRIAQSGYYVLLPNLYYRTTREFELGATRDHPDAEANLKKMFAMVDVDFQRQGGSRCRRDSRQAAVAGRRQAGQDRAGRLLHERRLRHRGGGPASRPHRLLRVLLRNAADHRQARTRRT